MRREGKRAEPGEQDWGGVSRKKRHPSDGTDVFSMISIKLSNTVNSF